MRRKFKVFTGVPLFVLLTVYSCGNSTNNRLSRHSKQDVSISKSQEEDSIFTNDYLIYFQKNGKNYDCMKKVLPNGVESLIARFTVKPLDVVWDVEQKIVYFVTQGGVFKKNYLNSSSLECISDPLSQKENESFGEAWIDQKSGNIQISYSIVSYESNPKFEKRFKKLSSDSSVFLPDWGIDMIACISELGSNGKWKLVKEKASRGQACDTPGLDVLRNDINRKKNTTSNQFELFKSTYYGRVVLGANINEKELDSVQIKEIFNNKVPYKTSDEVNEYVVRKIPISGEQFILVPIYWIGTPYFSTPVFGYHQQTKEKKELKELRQFENSDSDAYIGISVVEDYVMFTTPYEENRPFIYSCKTLDILGDYPKAEEIFILVDKK